MGSVQAWKQLYPALLPYPQSHQSITSSKSTRLGVPAALGAEEAALILTP